MPHVEIIVKGRIDEHWSDWLGGLAVSHNEWEETVLSGSVVDAAALYGLLTKLRDLGLPLLAVRSEEMGDGEPDLLGGRPWPSDGPNTNGSEI